MKVKFRRLLDLPIDDGHGEWHSSFPVLNADEFPGFDAVEEGSRNLKKSFNIEKERLRERERVKEKMKERKKERKFEKPEPDPSRLSGGARCCRRRRANPPGCRSP